MGGDGIPQLLARRFVDCAQRREASQLVVQLNEHGTTPRRFGQRPRPVTNAATVPVIGQRATATRTNRDAVASLTARRGRLAAGQPGQRYPDAVTDERHAGQQDAKHDENDAQLFHTKRPYAQSLGNRSVGQRSGDRAAARTKLIESLPCFTPGDK